MPRRPFSTLLAGLVAWFSVASVGHSAAAQLGDPSAGADTGQAAVALGLAHLARPDNTVARPHSPRGGDT